jgi:cell wall-associated NlpC family hydrolase
MFRRFPLGQSTLRNRNSHTDASKTECGCTGLNSPTKDKSSSSVFPDQRSPLAEYAAIACRISPVQRLIRPFSGQSSPQCLLKYIPVSNNEQRMPSRGRLLILLITTVVITSISASAFAAPADDKRKKAADIAAQIDSNGDKISVLAESYNEQKIKLEKLRENITDAKSQLIAAEEQNELLRSRVQRRAVTMYTASSDNDDSPQSLPNEIRRDRYADIATGNDTATIQQLEITKEALAERKAALEDQLKDVEAKEAELKKQKKEIEEANAAQKRLLDATKGELAALIAEQQERARSSEIARAARTVSNRSNNSNNSNSSNNSNAQLPANLPAPSPKAAIAINYARQQLGKPYKYAATGPNSFDCSGLTMRAWGAAGVSMPHFSGAQANMFPQVPLNALQPGDLVFRPGHIGLYIGNGMMIHAPQTGDVVKISPIRKITKASRPG